MEQDPVIWEKVEWRQGDGSYRFELQQGGLHATLTAPHGRSFTIPTVAWYALLDALAASRKTKAPMPAGAPLLLRLSSAPQARADHRDLPFPKPGRGPARGAVRGVRNGHASARNTGAPQFDSARRGGADRGGGAETIRTRLSLPKPSL